MGDLLIDTATWFSSASADQTFKDGVLQPHVLRNVRISESSGDRAVDAQGASGARKAILFFFARKSSCDGLPLFPAIEKGDLVCRDVLDGPPPEVWTVAGISAVRNDREIHHWEVSLV